MADFENESLLFAENLFLDLMSLHPFFKVYLPKHSPTLEKSSHFTHAISKAVMVFWKNLKKNLDNKFRREFNSYSKGDAAVKVYLSHLCHIVRETTSCKISYVLGLSAVLLELITVLYRRGHTHILSEAPMYWYFMLKILAFEEFYKERGWEKLTALSKELEIEYDNSVNEIYSMYWHSDSIPCAKPGQRRKKRSKNSTETSNSIVTDLACDAVIAVKAGLDTPSKDNVKTDFEGVKLTKDPIILKTLELTKQFSKEMTLNDEKAGKQAISEVEDAPSSSVITIKAGLDTLSKDNVETNFEAEKPSQDPDIPKTLELTKQFSKEMILKDEKSLDSEEKGEKPAISKVTPGEVSPSKIKSGDMSETPEKCSSSVKNVYVSTCLKASAPKSENVRTTSMESASPKAVAETSDKDSTSDETLELMKQFSKEITPKEVSDSVEKGRKQTISEVEDAPTGSVITVKAGLDTLSKDNVETNFEGGKPSKDPVIPKILEQTKQFSEEMAPKVETSSDSEEKEGKQAISEVEDASSAWCNVF